METPTIADGCARARVARDHDPARGDEKSAARIPLVWSWEEQRMKLLATTCACLLLGLSVPAAAQSLLVGGGYGQTARLVITAGDPIPTESGGCAATARILTRLLLPAAERSFDLRPGQAGFVQVNLNSLAGSPGRRVELLPAVTVLTGRCAASIEIFDNATGRTSASAPVLLLPASGALPSIGPALGQIVRVGVIRGFDPQPEPPAAACTGVIGFTDAAGNRVGPSRAIDLPPGGSTVLDLDAGLLLPAVGESHRLRRFVQPKLLLPASGGGDTSGCTASVQLIDRLTGLTTLAYSSR
jgi:hypothetical protein